MNYGLRYPFQQYATHTDNYHAFAPGGAPIDFYLKEDKNLGDYGKSAHQFIPKDYV